MLIPPVVFLPIARVNNDFELANSELLTTDLKKTVADLCLVVQYPLMFPRDWCNHPNTACLHYLLNHQLIEQIYLLLHPLRAQFQIGYNGPGWTLTTLPSTP